MHLQFNLRKFWVSSVVILAFGLFICSPFRALAQVRGAQKLMKVQTVGDLQKLDQGDIVVMTCAKCKDTYVQVVEKTFRTVKPEELKEVTIHLCDSCDTKIETKGTGKQATAKLVHTCKTCGSKDVTCAAIKKDSLPALGASEDKK